MADRMILAEQQSLESLLETVGQVSTLLGSFARAKCHDPGCETCHEVGRLLEILDSRRANVVSKIQVKRRHGDTAR